jgi:macrolide-specific efflux system membrane fusion protein
MSGTVVAIVTKEGQTLNSAQQVPTIVKLARLDKMQVKIQISEADVARVKPGQPVYFTLMGDSGHRYHSRLQVVEPVPDSANQDTSPAGGAGASAVYYNGSFSVSNPEGKLRIGMTAQVTIVLGKAKNAVTIPIAALGEKRSNGYYVVQVLNNGQPEEREVQVGVRDNMNVQIIKGLKAGEQVLLQDAPEPGSSSSEAE